MQFLPHRYQHAVRLQPFPIGVLLEVGYQFNPIVASNDDWDLVHEDVVRVTVSGARTHIQGHRLGSKEFLLGKHLMRRSLIQ